MFLKNSLALSSVIGSPFDPSPLALIFFKTPTALLKGTFSKNTFSKPPKPKLEKPNVMNPVIAPPPKAGNMDIACNSSCVASGFCAFRELYTEEYIPAALLLAAGKKIAASMFSLSASKVL